jgi:hypothetical protein
MNLPFTVEQFFDVFGTYNRAIWPAQILAYILGIIAVILAFRRSKNSSKIIFGILSLFWMWIGIFYHIYHFKIINPTALIFGTLFMLQGSFFALLALYGGPPFRFDFKTLPLIGSLFILYAMVIYPLLGVAFGHSYPKAPMFGVAPCPTTIFTFGILLWMTKPLPGVLLIIPFLWSLIGMSAAVSLRVPQDYGLVFSGIVGTVLIVSQNRKMQKPAKLR